MCDCKIPEANRGGAPLELTLDNWLGLQIVPMYQRILKDKLRGMGKAHI